MATVVKACGNCVCFLLLDPTTGRGRCRMNPPDHVRERDATKDDVEGKRWPLCWDDEWCNQWVHK